MLKYKKIEFIINKNVNKTVRLALPHKKENCFWNQTFDKNRLKNFVLWFLKKHGEHKTVLLVEELKNIGFQYATKAGLSLGIEDLKIPNKKYSLMMEAEQLSIATIKQYKRGEITGVERFQRLIDTWHRTSERLKQEVIDNFEATDILNPVYMMAFSGARGNISQVRQLVGMRGLMSNPQGQIIDFPIRSNFREGLTLTEYIISSYGARKGIVDTALRTANAGYLTRRLVDVAQHVMISNFDCGTKRGIFLVDMKEGNKVIYSLQNRLIGRVLARDVFTNENIVGFKNSLLAARNTEISIDLATSIALISKKVFVRSSLTCQTKKLICQLCYGWSLAQGNLVSIGEAVGVVAGQSIGEPGTQLTMRTFHTGGVFSGDVSDQIRAPFDGIVKYINPIAGLLIRTPEGKIAFLTKNEGSFIVESLVLDQNETLSHKKTKKFKIPSYTLLFLRNGEKVSEKEVIAQISSINRQKNTTDHAELTIKSDFSGQFYSKNLDLKENKVGPKSKIDKPKQLLETAVDPVYEAWGWGYTWVLSGKIFQLALSSSFFPYLGDYVNKKSYMNQINWNISSTFGTRFKLNLPTSLQIGTNQKLLNKNRIKLMRNSDLPLLDFNELKSKPSRLISSKPSASTNFSSESQILLKTNLISFELSNIIFKKLGYFLKLSQIDSLTNQPKILSTKDPLFLFSSIFSKNNYNLSFNSPIKNKTYLGTILKKNRRGMTENLFKSAVVPSNWESSFDILLNWFPKRFSTKGGGLIFIEPSFFNKKINLINNNLISLRKNDFVAPRIDSKLEFEISLKDKYILNKKTILRTVNNFSESKKELTHKTLFLNNSPAIDNSFKLLDDKIKQTGKDSFFFPTFVKRNKISVFNELKKEVENSLEIDNLSALNLKLISNKIEEDNSKLKNKSFFVNKNSFFEVNLNKNIIKINFNLIDLKKNKNSKVFLNQNTKELIKKLIIEFYFYVEKQNKNLINIDLNWNKNQIDNSIIEISKFSNIYGLNWKNSLKLNHHKFISLNKNQFECDSIYKRIFWVSQPFFNFSLEKKKIISLADNIINKFSLEPYNQNYMKPFLLQRNRQGGIKSFYSKESYIETDSLLKTFKSSNSELLKKMSLKEFKVKNTEKPQNNKNLIYFFKSFDKNISFNLKKRNKVSNLFFMEVKRKENLNKLPKEGKLNKGVQSKIDFLNSRKKPILSLKMFTKMVSFPYFLKNKDLILSWKKNILLKSLAKGIDFDLLNNKVKSKKTEKNKKKIINYKNFFFNFYFYNLFNKSYQTKKFKNLDPIITNNTISSIYLKDQVFKNKISKNKFKILSSSAASFVSIERKKQLKNWFLKAKYYKNSYLKRIFSFNKKLNILFIKKKLMNKENWLAFLKQKHKVTKLLINQNFDAQLLKKRNKVLNISKISKTTINKKAENSLNHTLPFNIKFSLKFGWFYYSTNLSDLFLVNKKLLHPGKILLNNFVFDRHSIFIEILSFNKKSLIKTFYDFSFGFFNPKINFLVPNKKMEVENSKSNIIYGLKNETFNEEVNLTEYNSFINNKINSIKIVKKIRNNKCWFKGNINEMKPSSIHNENYNNSYLDKNLLDSKNTYYFVLIQKAKEYKLYKDIEYKKEINKLADNKNEGIGNQLLFKLNKKDGYKLSQLKLINKSYNSTHLYLNYKTDYYNKQKITNQILSKYPTSDLIINSNFGFYSSIFDMKQENLINQINGFNKLSQNPSIPGPTSILINSKENSCEFDSNFFINLRKSNNYGLSCLPIRVIKAINLSPLIISYKTPYALEYPFKKPIRLFKKQIDTHFLLNNNLLQNDLKKLLFSYILKINSNKKLTRSYQENSSKINFSKANSNLSSIFASPIVEYSLGKDFEKSIAYPHKLNLNKIENKFDNFNSDKKNVNNGMKTVLNKFISQTNEPLFGSLNQNNEIFNNNFKNKEMFLYKTEFVSFSNNTICTQLPLIKTYTYSSFEGELIYKKSNILSSLEPNQGRFSNYKLKNETLELSKIIQKSFDNNLSFSAENNNKNKINANIISIQNQNNNCMILTKNDLNAYYFPFPGSIKEIVNSLEKQKKKNQYLIKDIVINYLEIIENKENSNQKNSNAFNIKINNLSAGKAQQINKLLIGEFLVYGDQISPDFAISTSGQIIHINNQKITIRRGQPIFVSPKAILHKYDGDFIDEYSSVITLAYQQLKTGDIIQGIPKVEQFFEARTTKRGRLFRDSLSNLLKGLFKRYRSKLPLDKAARQSFYKIQQIIVDGVQRVYRSQGVSIADKHLEIIVKQMTSKVRIIEPGLTGFFPGEIVSLDFMELINSWLTKKILYEPIVLGITKSSLEIDSFLSAASFQQTTRVLSKSAIFRKKDFLKGLKENVILGNLMPAGTGYLVLLDKVDSF